ncbi:fimbrial protein [Serratia quinivorans]|uniref:fimbrial protein n=1 Tax=Serratia quinivorans TaxID=137545 RepID=UPI002E79BB33|nr:fimbrial protein [Serratia quinivorans]
MQVDAKSTSAWLAVWLCAALAPWPAAWGGEGTLNVSAVILNGTCEVAASPGAITFDPVRVGRFNGAGQTAQVKPLHLTLSACQGIGEAGMSAAVRVNGTVAPFDSALFLDAASSTQGLGVMLRTGKYTGPLGDFYDAGQAVRNGDYSFGQPVGQAMPDGGLDYSVGLTNGTGQQVVLPGDLAATLQFTFLYH